MHKFVIFKKCIILSWFALISFFSSYSLALNEDNKLVVLSFDSYKFFKHPFEDDVDQYLKFLVLRPIFSYDEYGKLKCELCQTLPSKSNGLLEFVVEKNIPKIILNITIKPSSKWADGVDIDANDVVFSYKLWRDYKLDSYKYWWIDYIDDIQINSKDSKKFIVKILGHDENLLKILTEFIVIPSHIEAEIWNEKSDEYVSVYLKNTNYIKNPATVGLYNGPYYIKKYDVSKKLIELEQNPYFYSKKPIFKNIILKYDADIDEFLQFHAANNFVVIKDFLYLSYHNQNRFINYFQNNKILNSSYVLECKDSDAYEVLVFNLKNPKLANLDFRKALYKSIAIQKIQKEIFKNIATTITDNLKNNIFYQILNLHSYDFKEALKLFSNAGWQLNSKDKFLYKNNIKLTINIDTLNLNPLRKEILNLIKLDLRKIGIELNVNTNEVNVVNNDIVERANFEDLALLSFVIPDDTNKIPTVLFHSKEIVTYDNNYRGLNIGAWHNLEVDQLLQIQNTNNKKNIDVEKKFLEEYQKDLPFIPMFFHKICRVVPKNLKNYSFLYRVFWPSSLNIENWEFDTIK